jgi:molybdate transport repressor ModE-like protein
MNDLVIHPDIKLTFAAKTRFFGPGTVMLLKEIETTGNVREACANCGFSYSKGWTIIRKSEQVLGYKIVERQVGGQSGGSAKVTANGRALMKVYEELYEELKVTAASKFNELNEKYSLLEDSDI